MRSININNFASIAKRALTVLVVGFVVTACASGLESDYADNDSVFDQAELSLSSASCKVGTAGGAKSCATAAHWKKYAHKTCSASGLRVTDWALGSKCGKDGYSMVKFQCCESPDLAVVTPEKPSKPVTSEKPIAQILTEKPSKPELQVVDTDSSEPEIAQKCFVDTIGGGKACFEAGHLKAAVYKTCASKGGRVTAAKFGQSCKKGGYTGAKFECCKDANVETPVVVEPVAPEQKCFLDSIGSDTKDACYKAEFLKAAVHKTCSAAGADLAQAKLASPCKDGGFTGVKFRCCKSAPPLSDIDNNDDAGISDISDEEPELKCFATKVGGANWCINPKELKHLAAKTCEASGAELTKLSTDNECKGGYNGAKILCCKSAPVISDDSDDANDGVIGISDSNDEPASKCYTNVIGQKQCLTGINLKHWASKECQSVGGNVTALSLGYKCKGDHGYGYEMAKFSCCVTAQTADITPEKPSKPELQEEKPSEKPSTDNEKPQKPGMAINLDKEDGPMCVTKSTGSPDTCLDAASWKKLAMKKCASAGMKVTKSALGVQCKGGYSYAKFTCCGK
jgi:hypothetical protein